MDFLGARGGWRLASGYLFTLASGYLFTLAFDPDYRWLMPAVLPPEPHRPWFLQRCACAYVDDFALATASLRESLPTIADACSTIDTVTGMSLNHKKCHWIQYRNLATSAAFSRSQHPCPQSSGKRRSRTMPSSWASKSGLMQLITDGPIRGTISFVCARIRTSSQSHVQRLVPVKFHALFVLSFIGSIAESDAVRQARAYEEHQMGKLLSLCGVRSMIFFASRFN